MPSGPPIARRAPCSASASFVLVAVLGQADQHAAADRRALQGVPQRTRRRGARRANTCQSPLSSAAAGAGAGCSSRSMDHGRTQLAAPVTTGASAGSPSPSWAVSTRTSRAPASSPTVAVAKLVGVCAAGTPSSWRGLVHHLADRDRAEVQLVEEVAVLVDEVHRQLGAFGGEPAQQLDRLGCPYVRTWAGSRRCRQWTSGSPRPRLESRRAVAVPPRTGWRRTSALHRPAAGGSAGRRTAPRRPASAPITYAGADDPQQPGERLVVGVQRDRRHVGRAGGEAAQDAAGPDLDEQVDVCGGGGHRLARSAPGW